MARFFKHIYENFEEYFSASLIAIMIVCLGLQVLLRYVFGTSLSWSEELSRFCFIWTIYVGIALAAKRMQHVRVTAVYLLMPKQMQLVMWMLVDAIWVAFNLIFAWQGILMVINSFEFVERTPTLEWVAAYIYMIIPFGFILMSWRIIEIYIKHLRSGTLHEVVQLGGH